MIYIWKANIFQEPCILWYYLWNKGKRVYRKGKKIDPNNPEVYLAEGRNYLFAPGFAGGSKKKAILSFKKAIEIFPNYHWSYLWLGQAYLVIGEKDKAMEQFKKALNLCPINSWAKYEIERLK
ncbi:MAG: tetratricopeptide repeat protein [bacterium]